MGCRSLMLVAALIMPGHALAAPWSIDPGTSVAVDVTWAGTPIEVRFPSITGVVDFDEHDLSAARATISVATAAATTGLAPADAMVRSEGYLDAANHPAITFHLDRLAQTSKSTADVIGRITLRGITQAITFKASVIRFAPGANGFEAGFDLSGTLDRTTFGSTAGLPEIPATLPVRIRLLLSSN